MKIDPRFKDTEFVITCDSFARQSLWEKFSTQAMFPTKYNTVHWKQDSSGVAIQIGTLDNRPVVCSFFWAKLNNHLVVFCDPTSQVVDYGMVDSWLDKYCKPTYDDGRLARCNAENFHHVLHYIQKAK